MESQSSSKVYMNNYGNDDQQADMGIKPMSAQQFTDTFLVTPKPATDTGAAQAAAAAQTQTPVLDENPDADPIFTDSGREDVTEQEKEQELVIRKWNKEELEGNLEMMLNFRSLAQAEILSWISGEASSKYELDEDMMQQLARVYAPYMKKWGNKIPDWFWLLLAEGIIMTPLIRGAIGDRKANLRNAALASSDGVQQAVRAAAAAPTGDRKNYSIDDDGFYVKDGKSNNYLKKAKRTVKASFDDIQKILEDNELETVRQVFPQLVVDNSQILGA